MARTRSIWPEFFTNAELAALSPLHRVLYAGIPTVCDWQGRGDDKPADLKIRLLPLDDDADVDAMMDDFKRIGLVTRYSVARKKYFEVNRDDWRRQHPHIDERNQRVRPPPEPDANTGYAPGEPEANPQATSGEPQATPDEARGKPGDLLSLVSDHREPAVASAPAAARKGKKTRSGEHAELIAYGVEVIETTTGVKYSFRDEDAGQAKRMLKALGLAESRKVFDLAAARHQRDDFHRQRGLTFRLVANDANALRTAGAGGGRPKFAPLTGTSDRFRDMDDGDPLNLGNDAVRDE